MRTDNSFKYKDLFEDEDLQDIDEAVAKVLIQGNKQSKRTETKVGALTAIALTLAACKGNEDVNLKGNEDVNLIRFDGSYFEAHIIPQANGTYLIRSNERGSEVIASRGDSVIFLVDGTTVNIPVDGILQKTQFTPPNGQIMSWAPPASVSIQGPSQVLNVGDKIYYIVSNFRELPIGSVAPENTPFEGYLTFFQLVNGAFVYSKTVTTAGYQIFNPHLISDGNSTSMRLIGALGGEDGRIINNLEDVLTGQYVYDIDLDELTYFGTLAWHHGHAIVDINYDGTLGSGPIDLLEVASSA